MSSDDRILLFYYKRLLFSLAGVEYNDLWNFIIEDYINILPLPGSLPLKFIVNYFVLMLSIGVSPITLIIPSVTEIYSEWRETRSQSVRLKQ